MHLQLSKAGRLGKHGNKGLGKCTDHNSKSPRRRMDIVGCMVRFMRNKDLNDAVLESHGPCVFLMPGVIYFL